MRKSTTVTFALASVMILTAPALAARLSHQGEMFLTEAIKGDGGEVAAGRLAQQRGGSRAVRDYGAMLIRDHGAHKATLVAMAGQMHVRAPSGVTPDAKMLNDRLMRLHGRDFDRVFGRAMVDDHQKDIAKYEAESRSRADRDLARMASDTLPTLRHHLELARRL